MMKKLLTVAVFTAVVFTLGQVPSAATETVELGGADISSGTLQRIAQFGSLELAAQHRELNQKYDNGDEFDKNSLRKPIAANKDAIAAQQKENSKKTFVFYLPYEAVNIEVSDTTTSTDLLVRTGMTLDGIAAVKTTVNGIAAKQLKRESGSITLPVSGPTEIMKSLVREKGKYEVQLTVANLHWDNGVSATVTGISISINEQDERLRKKWAHLKSQALTVKGAKFRFRECPAGSFNREGHKVTLSGFYIGETEVTQEQWEAVMGKNPSDFKGDKLPVEQVSWNTCQEFIKKLNDSGSAPEGYKFALPTEAQWEYACRAGSTTDFCFGDNEKQLGDYAWYDYAWYSRNSGDKTHEVGTKKSNAWGIYDMHGNVWEWCSDWYGNYPRSDVVDPTGASSGDFRVRRGGGWSISAGGCRSAYRGYSSPGYSDDHLGLRVALVPSK